MWALARTTAIAGCAQLIFHPDTWSIVAKQLTRNLLALHTKLLGAIACGLTGKHCALAPPSQQQTPVQKDSGRLCWVLDIVGC